MLFAWHVVESTSVDLHFHNMHRVGVRFSPWLLVYWFRCVEPTSVGLTPSSHHQPQGASPRLFCVFFVTTRNASEGSPRQQPSPRLRPATKPTKNQEQKTSLKKHPSATRAQKLRKLHRVCWWFRPGTLFRLRKATPFIQHRQSPGNNSAYTDQINSPIRVFPEVDGSLLGSLCQTIKRQNSRIVVLPPKK